LIAAHERFPKDSLAEPGGEGKDFVAIDVAGNRRGN
jgi:hypothetical protein